MNDEVVQMTGFPIHGKLLSQKMNILSLDTEYRYLYFNMAHAESMLKTYGCELELGACIFDMITVKDDIDDVKAYYDRALAGEAHISLRVAGVGTQKIYYETFYNPIFNQEHTIIGVSVFAQDVTQRKLAEFHVQESDSMRELLLDIITHDLKNPVGVIMGMSEMLRREYPNEEMAKMIYNSCERLLEVLSTTTMLSQATFGEHIPEKYIKLRPLIHDVVSDFESPLSYANMDVNYDGVEDLEIYANPIISEVFKNYISNAIKYASEGKHIFIDSEKEQGAVIIRVRDLGNTIDVAHREAIFERRTQLAETDRRGRGLGLAIVKRIAETHGGEAWVEPNEPQGNSFCLRLQNPD